MVVEFQDPQNVIASPTYEGVEKTRESYGDVEKLKGCVDGLEDKAADQVPTEVLNPSGREKAALITAGPILGQAQMQAIGNGKSPRKYKQKELQRRAEGSSPIEMGPVTGKWRSLTHQNFQMST